MNYSEQLRQISPGDFALLGMAQLAYVRRTVINDQLAYELRAADGTQIGLVATPEIAAAILRRHDLEPASLH